jgi:4-hydroxymandelate oxidase
MTVSRRDAVLSTLVLTATAMIPENAAARLQDGAARSSAHLSPGALLNLDDYEQAARAKIAAVNWEYIEGGAADEVTVRWNRDAYRGIKLLPRQLNDVSKLDTRVRLLGHELPHPILLAPTACHMLAHSEGEMATAKGARDAGAGMVLSTYTTVPVERVAVVKPPLFWFQLYVQDRPYTQDLIHRAAAAGCTAMCVTIDTPNSGARNRQERSRFKFPTDLPHISGKTVEHPLTWRDLEWIRAASTMPVFLKGVLHPDDAELGIRAGAAGIMVSNHGGRNLDTTPATIDALPMIVDRVSGRVPVIVDGGIRRGTDVLKALAHGADAVMIGRPYVHGLAVAGADGVTAVINILRKELELAMALVGKPTIASIDRSILFAA